MVVEHPAKAASQLIDTLRNDLPKLRVLEDYLRGAHPGPYVPESADAEYRLLAERCVTNWMPLLVRTPAQAMYVDGFNYGNDPDQDATDNFAWQHWQRSGLDARQDALYEGSFSLGHGFTVAERSKKARHKGKSVTRVLSAMLTSALYEDPVNDIDPVVALTVRRWPKEVESDKWEMGEAEMWDDTWKYSVKFDLADASKRQVRVERLERHGASECPVTRFPAAISAEGVTTGVIEPMIPVQDRINQSIFDLLMVQTNGSFEVRWSTGMAPPLKKEAIYLKDEHGNIQYHPDGKPVIEAIVDVLDEAGRPVPEEVQLSTKRFLMAEDPDAKFGSLSGTPLDGYIASIDMSIRHLAMLSQTPPTHMMGSIVNLSAEAMASAEIALRRKVENFKAQFGECWERDMNIAAEIDGNKTDDRMETVWRDMEGESFAKSADALLKLKEIGVPKVGLWSRIPGVTATELENWRHEVENNPESVLASFMNPGPTSVKGQTPNSSPETMKNADPDLE